MMSCADGNRGWIGAEVASGEEPKSGRAVGPAVASIALLTSGAEEPPAAADEAGGLLIGTTGGGTLGISG